MGVIPKIADSKQGKELLLEIDSIVPDTAGHHLADVSLSSNDSLSRSRRRWNLIKIVSKMNPSFNGKSKKLIFYQSLSALLSLILTGITIYWLVQMRVIPDSPEFPSSSSSSSRSSSSSSSSELNSDQILTGLPMPVSEPDLPHLLSMAMPIGVDSNGLTQFPGESINFGNLNFTEERPVTSDDDKTFESSFDFAPETDDWSFYERFGGFNGVAEAQPEIDPFSFHFEVSSDDDDVDEDGNLIGRSSEIEMPFITSNFDSIKSSARNLHASALTAFDDLMGKLKASPLGDFLSGKDDEDPEVEKEVSISALSPSKTDEPNANQLDDTVDRVLMFVRKFAF